VSHDPGDWPTHSGLPAQPAPLIGRDAELALTLARLEQPDVRLLTLVGPAGTGKTRLAIEVAEYFSTRLVDGAYFVDLAPIADPLLVESAIGQTIGLRIDPSRPRIEALSLYLSTRHVLLLLDNFEQLIGAAPRLSTLLQHCPHVKLLVTSRSALRLRWEHVIPVPPLAVPSLSALPPTDRLAQVPAVALFVQRAQRADPYFALTPANAASVAAICVQLDGLPLAIELAAARTRVLPPDALLSRLGHRLDVLSGVTRDQPERQRTLRAALDWSHELLTPPEQMLFRRLGVFVGGFTLGAVGEVCELGIDALATIESLVDKSLVREDRTPEGHEPRFSMLETIREYAVERLEESGEREQMRRNHATYFLSGSDVPLAQIKLSQQAVWLQSLEAEHDNIRAALAWCLDASEPELGLSAAGLLSWFWIVRGYVQEGRRQLTALLGLAASSPEPLRAEAMWTIGSLALHQAAYGDARAMFEASMQIRRERGETAALLAPLSGLGAVAMQQGNLALAETYFEEALKIQQALEDRMGMAESLNSLANVAQDRGDLSRARLLYERSLSLQPAIAPYRADVVLHNLGVVSQEEGDLVAARVLFQQSADVKRQLGDTSGLALSLAKLGEVASSLGDHAGAHAYLSESVKLHHDIGDRSGIAFVFERFALAAVAHNQATRALRLGAAAHALRREVGAPLPAAASSQMEASLRHARASLGPTAADAAWAAGQQLPLEQALEEALASPTNPTAISRASDNGTRLSTREREVALLVAEGLTNRDIAERLVVSERTAENHVARVLNRLGLRSRAQVAAWVVRNDLMP
jgi:predicted ATPase/DNA-binding NarL/FixJ family response regulator